MENEIKTIKPNSPRWLDCDLNCTACEYASDCVFKQRHDEAEKKVWLKTKRKKKQKRIKRNPTTTSFNAREENARGSVPSALPSEDDEDEDMDDKTRCENCPRANECKFGKVKDCIVIKAKNENVDWFMPFWNEQRLKYGARLSELVILSGQQKRKLRSRQTRYGIAMVRQFVINLMKSDFVNGRMGKLAPSSLDFYLECHRFPKVIQGRYNDLAPEEQKPTAADLRRMEAEKREEELKRRREEAKRIEEEEAAARERQREYDRAHAARGEELQRILAEIELPPLRENEKSPKQRIFS